ncbi:MAG: hypothetical protein HZB26_14210 [Candidatus Hydrogenedentes bacterium]|nr:hypothetical protein [Candidatus Hydrogenedentota bacterium]
MLTMDNPLEAATLERRRDGDCKALEVFMVQHVSRVLEMVDYDLRKAAAVLDIDLNELIVNIARWDARPVVVTKLPGSASLMGRDSFRGGECAGLSPLEERCVDL